MKWKKIIVLLLALLLLFGTGAQAGAESAQTGSAELTETMTDGNYSIHYPASMHGFSAIDYDWTMDVALDVETEETVALVIIFTGPEDWGKWLATGRFPNDRGEQETMKRLTVDEPPAEPAVDAETYYALFQSQDGREMKEVFIVDPEEGSTDYVLVCIYPAGSETHRGTLLSMVETFSYAYAPGQSALSNARGSFRVVNSYEYDGRHTVVKDVVVNRKAQNIFWIFTESPVTKFKIEKLTWNDRTFKVKKAKVLYSRKKMETSEVVAVFDWLPEILPTVRFRAVNADGVEEVWYVSTNEENGSIILLSEEEMTP